MADRNVTKRKISRLRQTAIQTSSASRRFRAEDFEEARELRETGATVGREDIDDVIDRLQREAGEQFTEDEIHRYRVLLRGVPRHLHADAIRLDIRERRQKETQRRQEEADAAKAVRTGRISSPSGEPSPLAAHSTYVEGNEGDTAAKHVRSELSRLSNWQAQARELIGGKTRPDAIGQTPEESQLTMLEQQMMEARGDPDISLRAPDELTREEYEDTFRPEDVITRPEDREKINELFKRRNQLLAVESRMRERLQKLSGTAEGKPEGAARSKPTTGRQMRLPGVPEVRRDPRSQSLSWSTPPRAHGVEGALEEVRRERVRLERQLREFHPEAIVRGERQTREQTKAFTRRRLNETFRGVTDPLAPEPKRADSIRKPLDVIEATASQLEHQARVSLPLEDQDKPLLVQQEAKRLARQQLEEFIDSTAESYHGLTPERRLQAKQRSDSIMSRIATQTQAEVNKRELEAARRKILTTLLPQEAYTAEGYAKRSVDPSGARSIDELRRAQAEAAARLHPKETHIPREFTSQMEWELARQRGQAPPPPTWMPPTGFTQPPEDPNAPGGPKRAHRDPRFNELTVEDLYSAYGHEEPTSRVDWQKRNLQAKFEGREFLSPEEVSDLRAQLRDPKLSIADKELAQYRLNQAFTEAKPEVLRPIKQQAKFLKSTTQARAKGFMEGTEVIGVDNQGNPVTLAGRTSRTSLHTNPNARIGVSPNISYEYQLRNPKAGTDEAIRRQDALNSLLERRAEIVDRLEATDVGGDLKSAFGRRRADTDELLKLDRRIATQRKRVEEVAAPVAKSVLPTDLKTRFHEGRRNRFGELIEDEYDQLVAPAQTRQLQNETVRTHFGERIPKTGRERTPENIDEIRYIPSPGSKGETLTVDDPEGSTKNVYEIQDRTGKWRQVDHDEYEAARIQRERWDDLPSSQRYGASPPRAEARPIPRKIQYKYMDPRDLELNANARDIVTLKLPKTTLPSVNVRGRKIGGQELGERLGYLQFGENEASRLDQYPGRAVRSYAQAQKLDAAHQTARVDLAQRLLKTKADSDAERELLKTASKFGVTDRQTAVAAAAEPVPDINVHGIRDKSEARQLASAAVAAGFYTQRKHFMEGHLPNIANRAVRKVAGDKYNVGWAVNEAYVQPGLEKIANFRYGLGHPLTSPTTGASGFDVSSMRYRQNWIKRETMTSRALEHQLLQAERVARTHKFVESHRNERGPVGAFTRWRLGALERSPNYQFGNRQGIITQAINTAQEIKHEGTYTYRNALTGKEEIVMGRDITPEIKAQASGNLRRLAEIRNQTRPSFDIPSVAHRAGFMSRAIGHSGMERNILYGAAAVGAVAGAAYLYHRHQENKKPPEERVALYNKVLPPAFTTPKVFPHVQVESVYRFGKGGASREFGFAGKEIPTKIGVGFKSKRFAMRPMDRPAVHGSVYDPGLPIIGGISFRGAKGGSLSKSLMYDTPNVRRKPGTNQISRLEGDQGRRTDIRRATHEVSVLGHSVPGHFNIGAQRPIELSRTNPNRMTGEARENIIWAAQALGPDHEEHVKAFYRGAGGVGAERLLETWETPEEKQRIIRQKGRSTPQARAYQRTAEREYRRVTSAAR